MADYQEILDNLFDGVYTVTRNRKITYWNKTAEAMTGYSAEEVMGSHCYDGMLKHVDENGVNLCHEGCPLAWAMAHRCKHEANLFLHHKDGHRVPIRVRVSPTYDSKGQVTGAVELFSDMTPHDSIAQRLAELEAQSMQDPLTNLANQKYFADQIESYAKEIKRAPINIGVLLIAVDAYAAKFGAMAAAEKDQYQKIVAETLRLNGRPLDLFARLGEGVFAGILRNVTSNQLHTVAEKLRNLVGSSYAGSGEAQLQGTVSIGGTMLQASDTFESTLNRCQKQVDECVKQQGNKSNIELHFYPV